ncbi:hypothetical protein EW093_01580 [Thiospirochaeta perfilievii]|uniref:Beta-xylanase n=1 Tax=Thiospirochaeta perfilievii TaxID=252967 RepID=A0A5C1Q9H8_9SPIO|nr:endo-1,4-beta-xylanase [Thiospirochaeta perfilievii]QEN03446.1 hypothetical protein EW093_01580 [Thiospirochaeta perfilievii]
MLKKNIIIGLFVLLFVLFFSCKTIENESQYKGKTLLHTIYPDFQLGVAINNSSYFESSSEYNSLLKHFNSFVFENSMKMDAMQPSEGEFNFNNAKKMIKFAKDNDSVVRGHTLLWHSQYPYWFFTDKSGKKVDKDTLLKRIETHIKTIAGELKGDINTWDVVNEVLAENGTLRESQYYDIIGSDEYIEMAFRWARESDPKAKLFINDYGISRKGPKQDGLYNLVKSMLDRGVPIDGVGFQTHINLNYPSVEDIRKSIKRFAALGLDVQITELDISVYKSDNEPKKEITEEILLEQAYRYKSLFDMFKEEAALGNLSNVTIWGLTDDKSWLNDFPVKGRENAPLFFDGNLKEKTVYTALVNPEELNPLHVKEVTLRKNIRATEALSGTVNIDGLIDEQWDLIKPVPITVKTEGTCDEGSNFKTLWDNNYLYVLVSVVDSVLNDGSENPWEHDSIEIFIDENNGKTDVYESDDAQYRVSYNNLITFNSGDSKGFKAVAKTTESGYIAEVAIPMTSISLRKDLVMGFDIQINNSDANGVRVGVINWENSSNMGYQDTSGFGLLKLK